jgi:hypothetical protein
MQIEQRCWDVRTHESNGNASLNGSTDLVLAFGPAALINDAGIQARLREQYPAAHRIGCSSAGNIQGASINDDQLSITAVDFEKTDLKPARIELGSSEESYVAGQRLADALWSDDLRHVLVLLDGSRVNGSEFTRGLSHALPDGVSVTGGLAADGARGVGAVVLQDDPAARNSVAAIGFYGRDLKVACGCGGAWEPFGNERVVTRAKGNILLELDGRPALEVYENCLTERAATLPAAGLMYPISVRTNDPTQGVVRTAVQIDRQHQTVTFAGDLPENSFARLMRATGDRLIEGAALAADTCCSALETTPQLALLVSCVARRGLLKQRAAEEIEAVRDVVGPGTVLAGFYGFGEIAPHQPGERPELHNQTLCVTGFSEK